MNRSTGNSFAGRDLAASATLLALAIATLSACLPSACADEPEQAPLHVVLDRLPQCAYGIGLARPVRIELRQAGRLVTAAMTSGISTDVESLRVSLYAPMAQAGLYEVHIGLCPPLRDDAAATLACDDVEWIEVVRARLRPEGYESPQTIHPRRLRMECLDGQTAYYP